MKEKQPITQQEMTDNMERLRQKLEAVMDRMLFGPGGVPGDPKPDLRPAPPEEKKLEPPRGRKIHPDIV